MSFSRIKSALALLCVIFTTEAQADPWNMLVVNSTGKAIETIQMAPTTPSSTWPASTSVGAFKKLTDGSRMMINFDKSAGTCKFDLRATFSDATTAVYSGINVCDFSYVTLKLSNGKPVYTDN